MAREAVSSAASPNCMVPKAKRLAGVPLGEVIFVLMVRTVACAPGEEKVPPCILRARVIGEWGPYAPQGARPHEDARDLHQTDAPRGAQVCRDLCRDHAGFFH